MSLLPEPALLHGVDVEVMCTAVIARKLARNGGYLRADQRDDLLGDLIGEAGILAVRYRAELTVTFRLYADWQLERRMDDWYRRTLGDGRRLNQMKEVSYEQLDEELVAPSHEEEVLRRVAIGS